MNYECTVCGHVYVAEQGDKVGGVPHGTDFEDLPQEWACPICGIPKRQFVVADSKHQNGSGGALNGIRTRLMKFS